MRWCRRSRSRGVKAHLMIGYGKLSRLLCLVKLDSDDMAGYTDGLSYCPCNDPFSRPNFQYSLTLSNLRLLH